MKDAIIQLVERLQPETVDDYDTALKEVIQRLCLVGLWRGKFFEHAAFYGDTALRLLYGLDRFSEDLDFSLLTPSDNFHIDPYLSFIYRELESFGLEAEITPKDKKETAIAAAFVKSNTRSHRLLIGLPPRIANQVPANQTLKVKIEIDTDPPPDFSTEIRYMLKPTPCSIRSFTPADLFAGKMHALLCRKWGRRVKGRDWYDFVWFAQQEIPLNLIHLTARMRQTGHWTQPEAISCPSWKDMLRQAIVQLDLKAAQQDVMPFLRNPDQLDVWSADFFYALIDMIDTC